MADQILGIHHVTAMSGIAQKNVDFYAGVLGLRLVKKTVNFDAPEVYHFYYGDSVGSPGTIFTAFPFGNGAKGSNGVGMATATSFSIPSESFAFWSERLHDLGVPVKELDERDAHKNVIIFQDPDGLVLELVAQEGADARIGWRDGPVPSEHAILGFYGATICVKDHARTSALLTDVMGFRLVEHSGMRYRYEVGVGGPGTIVDVVVREDAHYGRNSIGTIHHIAWRVSDEDELVRWQTTLTDAGMHVTEVKDRNYFKSIYFREPAGVLFELATDEPGFAIDESVDTLGTELKLPDWLQSKRAALEMTLPPIRL